MNRSSSAMVAVCRMFDRARHLAKSFEVAACVAFVLVMSLGSTAQSDSVSALSDLLGPHNEGARGCISCHASRSATPVENDEQGASNTFLWGNSGPSYQESLTLTDESEWVKVQPAALREGSGDVTGVLLCLSCHDGNLTPYNMMQSWSYEHQVGMLASTSFRNQRIASLLGREEVPIEDHPIGSAAPIDPGGGLVFASGKFSVIPKSPYAQFVANYGWPSLAPRGHSKAFGVTSSGEPYTLCTTCHDQHVRNVYISGKTSPIAGDATGKSYTTYFFVNGPYNPVEDKPLPTASSEQFCRQCHFNLANEGNNSLKVRTFF